MSNCFPQIALLISSYNRPRHLALALTSIEHQRHDPTGMEVVITDDGSDSDTLAVVADYAARAKWTVKLTTHPHAAFHLARCRNEGVLASRAPYLLFLDGDCILPPDHVAQHLRRRRSGMVMAGDCCRLGANLSRQIDDVAIRDGQFLEWENAINLGSPLGGAPSLLLHGGCRRLRGQRRVPGFAMRPGRSA